MLAQMKVSSPGAPCGAPAYLIDEVPDLIGVGRTGPVLGGSHQWGGHIVADHLWAGIQASVQLAQVIILHRKARRDDTQKMTTGIKVCRVTAAGVLQRAKTQHSCLTWSSSPPPSSS